MATVIDKPPKAMPIFRDRPYGEQMERWRPLYRQRCKCVYLRIQARAVIGALTQAVRQASTKP